MSLSGTLVAQVPSARLIARAPLQPLRSLFEFHLNQTTRDEDELESGTDLRPICMADENFDLALPRRLFAGLFVRTRRHEPAVRNSLSLSGANNLHKFARCELLASSRVRPRPAPTWTSHQHHQAGPFCSLHLRRRRANEANTSQRPARQTIGHLAEE